MKIKYFGHSCFVIEDSTHQFKAIIDPFISGNHLCPVETKEIKDLKYIFITHGHGDHFGDTIELAKNNEVTIICNFELGFYLSEFNVHTMHIGGRKKFDFGSVKMTPALHGSGIVNGGKMVEGGNPCGFVIEVEGKKIYHAGDTGLTMDMKLLGDEKIDVALIPIGGNYTMDIDDAVRAVEFINPKVVVPMHYNTFDLIKVNPMEFKEKVNNYEVKVMETGESLEI